MGEPDHYAVLGVRPDATAVEIRDAYRRLAKLLHPDLGVVGPWAQDRMRALNRAYGVLSDTAARRRYDLTRRTEPVLDRTEVDLGPGTAVSVLIRPAAGGAAPPPRIEVTPRSGGFWTTVVAAGPPDVAAEILFRHDPRADLPPGEHTDRVRVSLDGVAATLTVRLAVPPVPRRIWLRRVGAAVSLFLVALALVGSAVVLPYWIARTWLPDRSTRLVWLVAGGLYVAVQILAPLYALRHAGHRLRRLLLAIRSRGLRSGT